jgi:hypothetical protein
VFAAVSAWQLAKLALKSAALLMPPQLLLSDSILSSRAAFAAAQRHS